MARTAIIGDVHGMLGALEALLGELALGPGDTLVSVGDLVDKGPDPAGVLDHFAALKASAPFDVVFVEGNHEDRHRRYQLNLDVRPGVAAKQAADAPELPALHRALSPRARAFLETAVPFHRLPALGVLVVHGGIPGDMRRFPRSVAEADALTGKERERFRKVLRTRYIDKRTGAFRGLDQELPGDPFWAEVYDGRFGHVVFGHHPFFDGPAEYPHATGIDTGAVHGSGLTGLVFDGNGARRFVSVETPVFKARRTLGPDDA